ncbi:unnamed protein product, partial [Rotaria sp. Silwood1]
IIWNIYQGTILSSNIIQWKMLNEINTYENIWFYGRYTKNFTATKQLLIQYPHIEYWRFEVIYSFFSETGSSSLNFLINHPPKNGSCSASPLNGTTNTLYDISCEYWSDEHEIKDYSVNVWTTDPLQRLMIGFSFVPHFQVRLPVGDESTSVLNMIVQIRDSYDCIAEWNISSIVVIMDMKPLISLIKGLHGSSEEINNNPLIRLLASGNQNTMGQIITLISQEFNKMNIQNI